MMTYEETEEPPGMESNSNRGIIDYPRPVCSLPFRLGRLFIGYPISDIECGSDHVLPVDVD